MDGITPNIFFETLNRQTNVYTAGVVNGYHRHFNCERVAFTRQNYLEIVDKTNLHIKVKSLILS